MIVDFDGLTHLGYSRLLDGSGCINQVTMGNLSILLGMRTCGWLVLNFFG